MKMEKNILWEKAKFYNSKTLKGACKEWGTVTSTSVFQIKIANGNYVQVKINVYWEYLLLKSQNKKIHYWMQKLKSLYLIRVYPSFSFPFLQRCFLYGVQSFYTTVLKYH